MSRIVKHKLQPPEQVAAIERRGCAVWAEQSSPPEFVAEFDGAGIPVAGIRLLRTWGIQVDDERELPGHERSFIADEENWQVILVAKDGSHYEVNSDCLAPAPD
jgi:hypothetical protein